MSIDFKSIQSTLCDKWNKQWSQNDLAKHNAFCNYLNHSTRNREEANASTEAERAYIAKQTHDKDCYKFSETRFFLFLNGILIIYS